MTLISINKRKPAMRKLALFSMGFRVFFLGAAVFSLASTALWMAVYVAHLNIDTQPLAASQWHAHEMIYGFSLAVIAGFLLTAIVNWTGVQTIQGPKLAGLFALWLIARVLLLCGNKYLIEAAIFDCFFNLLLVLSVTLPVIKTRNLGQLGIVFNLTLFSIGNICFYLGALGVLASGVHWGIYGGLYLIVALILKIGSRVFPVFVRNGVDQPGQITTPPWVAPSSFLLLILLFINEVFINYQAISGYLAAALFLINTCRLAAWHTHQFWSKPLLWSLYLSFVFITLGFLLLALSSFIGISKVLALHAFAYGGIGFATLGMMSRVTLGHTGRSIRNSPVLMTLALRILLLGAVFRIALPVLHQELYVLWISLAQVLWFTAFAIYLFCHSKMLLAPRIDGQPG